MAAFSGRKHPNRGRSSFRPAKRKNRARKVRVTYADGTTETRTVHSFTQGKKKRTTSYAAYLRSPGWKARRKAILERDGHRCTGCGTTKSLHVHHLTYERIGRERSSDLITLCRDCHKKVHQRERRKK